MYRFAGDSVLATSCPPSPINHTNHTPPPPPPPPPPARTDAQVTLMEPHRYMSFVQELLPAIVRAPEALEAFINSGTYDFLLDTGTELGRVEGVMATLGTLTLLSDEVGKRKPI